MHCYANSSKRLKAVEQRLESQQGTEQENFHDVRKVARAVSTESDRMDARECLSGCRSRADSALARLYRLSGVVGYPAVYPSYGRDVKLGQAAGPR
jgi:hypothetical protein